MTRDERWVALGQQVVRRRVELGWQTRQQLVEASGLSRKTLGEIERGDRTSYDPATLVLLERTLRWPEGHVVETLRAGRRSDAVIVDLTPQQLAGLDPIRPGVEFPPVLSDFLFWLTDEHSPLTREQREQVERTLNEYARTVAMLVRGNAVVEMSSDAGKSEAITRVTSDLIDPASVS